MRYRLVTSRLNWRQALPLSPGPAAFTLIELLVVMAIIALLVGILMPVLARARVAVVRTKCAANLRSIAQATLLYEVDHGRLPCHPYEMGDTTTMPASIKGPTFDARPLYAPYMNVDYFACPNVQPWRPSQSTAGIVNVDYLLTAGYYGDGDEMIFTDTWTRSDRPWVYAGRTISVIAGDKAFLDPDTIPGIWRHIVNHPDAAPGFFEWSPPWFAGSAFLAEHPAGTDVRRRTFNQFCFTDGRVQGFVNVDLVPVRNRKVDRPRSNYLMPADN